MWPIIVNGARHFFSCIYCACILTFNPCTERTDHIFHFNISFSFFFLHLWWFDRCQPKEKKKKMSFFKLCTHFSCIHSLIPMIMDVLNMQETKHRINFTHEKKYIYLKETNCIFLRIHDIFGMGEREKEKKKTNFLNLPP